MRSLLAVLWRFEFRWNLSRAAGTRILARELTGAEAALPHASMPGTDSAARFNRVLARTVHAAATLLEGNYGLPRDRARDVTKAALLRTGRGTTRALVRLWLWLERDPFAGVARRGPARMARALWGNGMQVEEETGPGRVSLCVRACPFAEYFWNASRGDLTPLLCAWDTTWMAEVNRAGRPLRVDLRGALASGAERCEFAFLDRVPTRRVRVPQRSGPMQQT